MSTFHDYRYKPLRYDSLYQRLWHFHDAHPLPHRLNRLARKTLYGGRRLRHFFHFKPRNGRDEYGDPVVKRRAYDEPVRSFVPPSLEAVEAHFRKLHTLNEYVYNGDGSWEPHPHMTRYGKGIPIEEVAERVRGYLDAYGAFRDPVFLDRAQQGGEYLLRQRLFADGHVRLEGHLVVELEYTYAGLAFLALWEHDTSRRDYLEAAVRIGDRLLEEHWTGAVDHAVFPAQLLAPLYRITGHKAYLQAALKRTLGMAVAFQLPYGGWRGDDSWIGYHASIGKSVIDTYVSLPNTLAYHNTKDRLASCATAALNRMLASQKSDGRFPLTRGDGHRDYNITKHAALLTEDGFVSTPMKLEDYAGAAEMDFLVSSFENLAATPAAIASHGYAHIMLREKPTSRLEFETSMVGQYARFLAWLERRSPQVRRRLNMPRRLQLQEATSARPQTQIPATPMIQARRPREQGGQQGPKRGSRL